MTAYKIPDNVVKTFSGQKIIMLHLSRNKYYALNYSASVFLKYLLQTGSFEKATEIVANTFRHKHDSVKVDMKKLLNSLIKSNLLERQKQ